MQRPPDVESQAPGASQPPMLPHVLHIPARDSGPYSSHEVRVDEKDPGPPIYLPKYGDTSAAYWNLYRSEAEASDKNLIEGIMNNSNPLIFLSTLFSSVVASFIIEIYKTLPGISQQTTNIPPSTAARINIVLFLSFFMSVTSALFCALIQQWCYEYLKFAYPQGAPHECGRVRTYLYQGLDYFQLRRFVDGTYVLLHTSFFLFFWAISDFFYTVHHDLGVVARYTLFALSTEYVFLSISPLIFSNSPYNTPVTPPLRAAIIFLRIIIRSPSLCLRWDRNQPLDLTGLEYYKGIHFDRARLYSIEAERRAKKLEPYAMEWLFKENDLSDNGMDKFLESLIGYMSSSLTVKGHLDDYLTADHILDRIKKQFITCAMSVELSVEEISARVSSSIKALWLIFRYSRECKERSSVPGKLKEALQLQRTYIQMLMGDFQALCGMSDPTIALRASCIRALAVKDLLSQLIPPDSTTRPEFPVPLIPIYNFFFPSDYADIIRRLDDGHTPGAMGAGRMWKNLLHDGPLANLTTLAQAVRDREHAPSSTLSFCWKALDILLTQLGTIHSEELTPAQNNFDNLHKDIRTYVNTKEQGFRVTPLLSMLDTVARGRRLLMVFSGHPEYRNKANVVFGKEYLRNSGLLEAFAHCLPEFISKNSPEVSRDFMEKVVCQDDLWTSLQENFWNTQRSDSPTPDKHRVFEDCCTVLDLAFSALEDSEEVDWRAPEFGSLTQHFESFITYCFQGASMGRATSFRFGIIKARLCNALLTQFWNDANRNGIVSFQSQWDVASLARLIYTLGLRDIEDAEFWNCYLDGGHIGADFTAKALEMIDITTREGPLLIFRMLGHLIATAVPLGQSGLGLEDIEKVWELQRKVVDNKRIPLSRASDAIWEGLGQLREQVNNLRGKITGKDIEILQHLLRMIDDVLNLRLSGLESPSQSEATEEQDSKTLSPEGSRGISNQFSFASEIIPVTRGPSSRTPTIEVKDGFGHKCLDRERETYGRSESPQSYELGSHSSPSRHLTVPGIPGVGIMERSTGTSSSAIYFPYMGDVRQRPSTRWTGSGSDATGPSLVTRASTSAPFTSRRDAPTILLSPAIGSLYGSFNLRDESQSGAAPASEHH